MLAYLHTCTLWAVYLARLRTHTCLSGLLPAAATATTTGEQAITEPFEELAVLTWTDLTLHGWPGGNYTLAVQVTGPSDVEPILVPLSIAGCKLGERMPWK